MSTLLSINNYYYNRGGADIVFLEHNRMFGALPDWTVVPFSMHHPKNQETPWSRYFVDEIEFGRDYSLAQKLTRLPKVIYSLEARRKLGRLIDDTQPDIAHAHNIYHHISPSILGLLKQRGVPSVITLHDLKIACPAYSMLAPDGVCERCRGGKIYNVVAHRCIKGSLAMSAIAMTETFVHRLLGSYRDCVDCFVVPSRFYIDKFVEWGWPRSAFTLVPNFVDVDRLQPDFTPGDAFVYVGRLSREKGLATVIRAAAKSGSRVRLAGTGPQLEELQALARELSADVTFLGFLSGNALHDAIRGARAVVLGSEWYENAPLSVLEAYALGKPVVGARMGGIPELVKEGVTGAIFKSGDVDSLAQTFLDMRQMPDAVTVEMGQQGRQWVEAEYTPARYRERILDIYARLIAGRRVAAESNIA